MSTVDELSTTLTEARDALAVAFARAAGCWDEPILEAEAPAKRWQDTGAWSPRQAAEHSALTERFYLTYLTACLASDDPPGLMRFATTTQGEIDMYHRAPKSAQFASPDDAIAVLRTYPEWSATVLATLTDADLERHAGIEDIHIDYLQTLGYPASKTIAGLLYALIAHTFDHAAQLERAVAARPEIS